MTLFNVMRRRKVTQFCHMPIPQSRIVQWKERVRCEGNNSIRISRQTQDIKELPDPPADGPRSENECQGYLVFDSISRCPSTQKWNTGLTYSQSSALPTKSFLVTR
ncbi:hypothetical protein RRG08_033104 [Elysia crispata]|uniref:Uncharacterized protein n=1 Tax=Elysia crispata TaxID=231223 RepID=A0AAE1BAZ1_9GAST|nr:hypothetical protein RRG08_033104 [Elysia crispata]